MEIQPIGALAVLILSVLCYALSCQGRSAMFTVAEEDLQRLSPGRNLLLIHELLRRPRRTSLTLWLGQRLSLLGMVAGGWWSWHLMGGEGLVLLLLVLSVLMILAKGLLTPKALTEAPVIYVCRMAWAIWLLDWLLGPVGMILDSASRALTRMVFRTSRDQEGHVLEQEVLGLVERGWHEGALDKEEHQMIHRVLEFGDRRVSRVMTPRADMFCLPLDTGLLEAMRMVRQAGYSRVPVYRDRKDEVVGILFAKDLLQVKFRGSQQGPTSLSELLRPPYFVPIHMEIGDLLGELRRRKLHMALCVDEYGGVSGLVTMEDLLEELFGEIYDEYDLEARRWEPMGEGAYMVSGKLGLRELEGLLGVEFHEHECNTVAGLVLKRLGHFPSQGEEVEVGGVRFQVEKVGATRILAVRVQPTS